MLRIRTEIYNEIVQLIDKRVEGDYWDYKQEWHKDNERLLLDILCFANTVHNKNCYIIIGIADSGDIIGLTSESLFRKNQTSVIDLLANMVFAGDYVPEVSVETIIVEGKELDILTIYNSYNVPFYLKSKSKKYHLIVEGYIYSRMGDRNTPVSQNSSMQQIELLWKKRLGLLSPPLEQIVSRMKSKSEWQELDDIYYNIYNPDFKIVERREEEYKESKREFYAYNQYNESTSYVDLDILCRETILKSFQVVVLDSGRYSTPTPIWGFIHDLHRHNKIIYAYKYMLKDSIKYAVQQFLFDEGNEEARIAKDRFDEVVLYFENQEEQQEFHLEIESCPQIVDHYINDAKLDKYIISSSNELEIKDSTEKLITAFAFKRYLNDFRRKKSGINVKRVNSIQFIGKRHDELNFTNIVEHKVIINETGEIIHSVYDEVKLINTYNYDVDKYRTRDFLNFIEPIAYDWEQDYSLEKWKKYDWVCTINYDDTTTKTIKGNIASPPFAEDIERRIINLAKYEITPWLFYVSL